MSIAARQLEPREQAYDWLKREAARRGIPAHLRPELARAEEEFLYLPVHIDGNPNALTVASALQDLEDSWNNRDPEPALRLLLVPTKD